MTPADKPDLPAPDLIWNPAEESSERYYNANTVRRLLADERRRALEEAAHVADGYPGAHSDDIARDIRALIDKELT